MKVLHGKFYVAQVNVCQEYVLISSVGLALLLTTLQTDEISPYKHKPYNTDT